MEDLKRAKEQFGGLTIREIVLLTAYRLGKLEERETQRNGRIGKLELKTWLIIAAVAALIGEGVLKIFAF